MTSTSSLSVPAVEASGLRGLLQILAPRLLFVSFLSLPYHPTPPEASVERVYFVDVYQKSYWSTRPNILTNLKTVVVLDGLMKLNQNMIGVP